MSVPPTSRPDFFAIIAQGIFRSRATPLLAALGIGAFTLVFAILFWEMRNFFAHCLSIYILFFGFRFIWELLPFSERTRTRWGHQRALAKHYFSYRCRKAVWVGVALLIYVLWATYTGRNVEAQDYMVPAVFLAWGALAYWYWDRVHAHRVEKILS